MESSIQKIRSSKPIPYSEAKTNVVTTSKPPVSYCVPTSATQDKLLEAAQEFLPSRGSFFKITITADFSSLQISRSFILIQQII